MGRASVEPVFKPPALGDPVFRADACRVENGLGLACAEGSAGDGSNPSDPEILCPRGRLSKVRSRCLPSPSFCFSSRSVCCWSALRHRLTPHRFGNICVLWYDVRHLATFRLRQTCMHTQFTHTLECVKFHMWCTFVCTNSRTAYIGLFGRA